MKDHTSINRRSFLTSSAAATIGAIAAPGSSQTTSQGQQEERPSTARFYPARNDWPSFNSEAAPSVHEYATLEAISNGVPVWSFSNLCYILGGPPDLIPGTVMQQGNAHSVEKIKLKKSWEIKHNLCGAESEMSCRTAYNDSQPMLPIHLIDGDPDTVWSSWGLLVPDGRPEWIRIDLPMETEVASIRLLCAQNFKSDVYGKALPKELEVKTSRDALHWETVYSSQEAPDLPVLEIKFPPHRAKQIWIIGQNFRKTATIFGFVPVGYVFSIGSAEVRDSAGNNLALVSRGASVTVSSVCYLEMNDRFTQDALWAPLNFDLGNKWLRIGGDNGSLMWHYTEHEKGKLEIDPRGDDSITECVRHGVNMIVNLDFKGNYIYENPPRKINWPESRFREMNDNYNDPLPAADANSEMYQGYLRYIEYMVRKLKNRVAYFELGNEWNGWFGAEHYLPTFFEPTYNIVKREWPEAKVMLGSSTGFDRNVILDCLGRQRLYGIKAGKLLLSAADATTTTAPGAMALHEDIDLQDATVTVEAQNHGEAGLLLRYKSSSSYLVALYSASDRSIRFHEVVDKPGTSQDWGSHWGNPLAKKEARIPGDTVKLKARIQNASATFTVSGGGVSVSTTTALEHIKDAGAVGVIHHDGETPQFFSNFQVVDSLGEKVANDTFAGIDGTVPAGWKYVNGGPNPIAKGWGARIDAIGWHPGDEPNAAYFSAVKKFQAQCRELGFNGRFFATEIYAGSMYPSGPQSYQMLTSEIQMAKYLVRSLVGHNGLGMEAGPCHPHFTGRVHPQALCQATWGTPTLNPCRPTMSYYMWRNIATIMDDFHASEFPVRFADGDEGLLWFTFVCENGDRLLAVWLDSPHQDEIAQRKVDVELPGLQIRNSYVLDIMNGTRQELEMSRRGSSTMIAGMLVKDYPVFVQLRP